MGWRGGERGVPCLLSKSPICILRFEAQHIFIHHTIIPLTFAMADQSAPSPSSAQAEGARADEPTTLGGAKLIDTYPEVERLLQQGVAVFSRGVLDIMQQQIQGANVPRNAREEGGGGGGGRRRSTRANARRARTHTSHAPSPPFCVPQQAPRRSSGPSTRSTRSPQRSTASSRTTSARSTPSTLATTSRVRSLLPSPLPSPTSV